jgi:hypothetical protein
MILWSLMCAWAVDGRDLAALADLPEKAQALRDHGLDADEVSSLLEVVRKSSLPRKEAVDLIAHAGLLVQEHGPIDDFSKFVDGRLQAGERGAVLHGSLTSAHKNEPVPDPAKPDPRIDELAASWGLAALRAPAGSGSAPNPKPPSEPEAPTGPRTP